MVILFTVTVSCCCKQARQIFGHQKVGKTVELCVTWKDLSKVKDPGKHNPRYEGTLKMKSALYTYKGGGIVNIIQLREVRK